MFSIEELFFETYRPDWIHLGRCPATSDSDFSAILAHVPLITNKFGDDVFIAFNDGNPICDILDPHGPLGFENGLIKMLEDPDAFAENLYELYDKKLGMIKSLYNHGCHAYIGSETYCSGDIISPEMYKNIVLPAQKNFYSKVRAIGLIPIIYFLGDILPLIPYINSLDVSGLMIEESKKNFTLDLVEIRQKLNPDITLFGNVDSVSCLFQGSVNDVKLSAKSQLRASDFGRFIMINGSPLAIDTPPENIKTMIDFSRS